MINRAKHHKGYILLVNASKQCSKGRPKNFLENAHIEAAADAYLKWKAIEGLSAIVTKEQAARNGYNLCPSRFFSTGEQVEILALDEAVVQLREAEEELEAANRELENVLKILGLT